MISPDNIAPLGNLGLLAELIDRLQTRPPSAPGMACFFGPSGYGKTYSAYFAAQRTRAYYVDIGDSWTRKTLCQRILRDINGSARQASLPDLVDEITDELSQQQDRPLIIDEADFLIKKGMVDLVREIHDRSNAPIIWLGEELLPAKLKKFERTDNRMYDMIAAAPCTLEDARLLCKLNPGPEIADDLLQDILAKSQGRTRRVHINIQRVREFAKSKRLPKLNLAAWGSQPYLTGEVPRRRVV